MDQLLADLLAYAQGSNIPDELTEPIPTAKPLEVALGNLAGSIGETSARITVGDLPVVRMREIHLAQLFQNLIGNAIKYRRDGVTPEVHVTAERSSDRWVFCIADNGIGISPEYKESIFGIFKRLHTNGKYDRTGMGLAICQRIVERYRGRIWVESEPGQGSSFLFTIPS
jgi:light-regulated signal transduction histidine kinase (bacteriophytochrome)